MAQTVTVGCKLPNGLHLEYKEKHHELLGSNSSAVIGGYGITENVDKELMDGWMITFKDSPLVKNNAIFVMEKTADAKAKAQDQTEVKSGLEPLNGDKLDNPDIKKLEKQ